MNCFHPVRLLSLTAARRAIWSMFDNAAQVHTGWWQGVKIDDQPAGRMFELMNVNLHIPQAPANVERLQRDLGTSANFPWAEDHFQERVCGVPINPGTEWANWPDGKSAARFLGVTRRMPPHDWAYLAGIIDGEGSFSSRSPNEDGKEYPRIKVTQVDEGFLRSLFERFGVGTFRYYSNPGNKLSSRGSWIWRISDKSSVRWVIEGCLPYLRLKRDRALEVLKSVSDAELPKEEIFNHNYMQRYWPAYASAPGFEGPKLAGIGGPYGDLNDLLNLLEKDPLTRQAYLPIFFPEDTGIGDGGRKPCTLGYQFMVREGRMHVYYPMRSCDFYRHWGDDCYLTVRLGLWIIDELRQRDPAGPWRDINIGSFTMHCTSLHMFVNDYAAERTKR